MKSKDLDVEQVRILRDEKRMTLTSIAKLFGTHVNTIALAVVRGRKERMAKTETVSEVVINKKERE